MKAVLTGEEAMKIHNLLSVSVGGVPHGVKAALLDRLYEELQLADMRPRIVCLCGSTRFWRAYQEANLAETLAGHIVLSVGCDTHSDAELFSPEELLRLKQGLDELHLRKIDLADEVLVLNVGGYIGESTHREIAYAEAHSKRVRYLEPVDEQGPNVS